MGTFEEAERRQTLRRVGVRRVGATAAEQGADTDFVATEEPLEIRLGYSRRDGSRAEENVSITMRTPGHDEELAVGFLFTEGIVRSRSDVQGVVARGPQAPNGLENALRVELAPGVSVDFKKLERHFYTTSSCGICGRASIDAVAVQSQFDIAADGFRVEWAALRGLPAALEAKQAVFERTGGLHASGLFDASGQILAVREDVGRHNALDKLIGHALLAGDVPLANRGIIVSGRASFELMQKAITAGCPMIAAVGAPSSLAVDLAAEFGVTLVGFLRAERCNVYTRPERVC